MTDHYDFTDGVQIVAARALLRLTRDELAERAGVGRNSLYKLERDRSLNIYSRVYRKVISKLADLGVIPVEGGVAKLPSADDVFK